MSKVTNSSRRAQRALEQHCAEVGIDEPSRLHDLAGSFRIDTGMGKAPDSGVLTTFTQKRSLCP